LQTKNRVTLPEFKAKATFSMLPARTFARTFQQQTQRSGFTLAIHTKNCVTVITFWVLVRPCPKKHPASFFDSQLAGSGLLWLSGTMTLI
jgi:hypothetical protein